MEKEAQERIPTRRWTNEELDHLVDVGEESALELCDVAHKHVDGGGLLLQRAGADGDPLVPEDENSEILVLLFLGSFGDVRARHVCLQPSRLQKRGHHDLQVRHELLPQALAEACPGLQHVGRGVVVVGAGGLHVHQRLHDRLSVRPEAVLADCHRDQGEAFHGTRAQHARVLALGLRHNLHKDGHDRGVVVLKGVLCRVGDAGHRREGALLDHLVRALQQLEQLAHENAEVRLQDLLRLRV